LEQTFVMIKPDGVQRALIGQAISRFESKGLKVVATKMLHMDKELASRHYGEHVGKPFYEKLVNYITSGPVLVMVLEGKDVISCVRTVVGKTNPQDAEPGTIRGDFGMEIGKNIIHASDSPESAKREISLFFSEKEIIDYKRIDEVWLYE
jgi:nucleoside-diphosphate kinase